MSDEKKMSVKYEEGPAERTLPTLGLSVARGEALEVPAAVGEQLLAQGWSKAEKPRTSKTSATKEADPAVKQED